MFDLVGRYQGRSLKTVLNCNHLSVILPPN